MFFNGSNSSTHINDMLSSQPNPLVYDWFVICVCSVGVCLSIWTLTVFVRGKLFRDSAHGLIGVQIAVGGIEAMCIVVVHGLRQFGSTDSQRDIWRQICGQEELLLTFCISMMFLLHTAIAITRCAWIVFENPIRIWAPLAACIGYATFCTASTHLVDGIQQREATAFCSPNWFGLYTSSLWLITMFLCSGTIIAAYAAILRKFHRMTLEVGITSPGAVEKEMRMTVFTCTICFFFAVSYAGWIFEILYAVTHQQFYSDKASTVTAALSTFDLALNPFLTLTLNIRVREHICPKPRPTHRRNHHHHPLRTIQSFMPTFSLEPPGRTHFIDVRQIAPKC